MSTETLPGAAQSSPRSLALPPWLGEPLLHFVVLGAVLFAVDAYLVRQADDPNLIVVGAEVDQEAAQLFEAARGRPPTQEELVALRRVWLDNEILYREGLAMRVDRGDSAIRDRVIFKALSMVNASLERPPVDDAALRSWFEENRARYDEPVRYDFLEAVLSGESSEDAVRSFAQRLNEGTPGDVDAGLRVFRGRPLASIEQSYGVEFAQSLAGSTPGTWQALRSREGWRAVQVESVAPARRAVYEELRGVVQQDWVDAKMSEQRTEAVRALERKYTIRFEPAGAGQP